MADGSKASDKPYKRLDARRYQCGEKTVPEMTRDELEQNLCHLIRYMTAYARRDRVISRLAHVTRATRQAGGGEAQ